MFDKFDEYMQYLLPSAFKRQKKQNQLLVYCRVIGRLYDSLLQSILRLREETIIATCSPEMLEVFGNDYDMPRMQGETDNMYRKRLQMKALVAETAGTQKGILNALASVGYDNCAITPFYLTAPDRWAEIRIDIFTPGVDADNPITFKCVVAEVLKVKQAGTLPHWRFYYPAKVWHTDINSIQAAVRFILYIQFWGDGCIYNGQNQYDGSLQYDTRRNYKTNILLINRLHIYGQETGRACTYARVQIYSHGYITAGHISRYRIKNASGKKTRMRIHMALTEAKEKIDNVYVETCRNVAFFDGTLKYDGTAKYDALYKKEEIE